MLILRIKQAECALSDGRLDEAYDLLGADDLRCHRRGQDLAGKLARALLARAQQHLDADRLPQAASDCDKATRLAGNLPDAATLRNTIVQAMTRKQQEAQLQAQAVVAAGRHIEQGQLSIGQKLLDGVHDGNGKAAALLQDVASRRVLIDAIADKTSAALHRDDWESAVRELARARDAKLLDSRLRDLVAQVTRTLTDKIDSAVQSGRLDLAASLLNRLSRISDQTVQSEQLTRAIEQCRSAWTWIECGQPHQAEEILRRLAAVLPSADWIPSTLNNLQQASQAMRDLRSGPLGLLAVTAPVSDQPTRMTPLHRGREGEAPAEPFSLRERDGVRAADPSKLLIQVDGIGSFLILRQPRLTIGPVSASPAVDVGLLTDTHTPPITIERIDEDYFVHSATSVLVNDKPAQKKLLVPGDRIALSLRCRMSFRRPSAASTSALLDLHSARLPRADVRHLILMDRELILGPGGGAHIRADDLPDPAVLYVRDNQIFCRAKSEMTIDGKPADKSSALPLGSHVQVGTVTFVVTPA